MIGTTSFINAVLQAKELNKVLTIRIGRPATTAVEPFFDWPSNLKKIVSIRDEIICGGHEYDGKEISSLDYQKLEELAAFTKTNEIKYVAITSVFANANPEHEKIAARILLTINPKLHITLSHEIGGINLLLRENAAILNAALSEYFIKFTGEIKEALQQNNLSQAKLFFSLNDGTLDNPQFIFPISTYCSGQSNSIRGASLLTNYTNAVVIDIGGTSADAGILMKGYPLESGYEIKIGNNDEGIICSFIAPLTRSYGLGGGSIIIKDGNGIISVRPESVGFRLMEKALIFGGNVLTVTDIAVAKGRVNLGDSSKTKLIPNELIEQADDIIHKKLAEITNKILPFIKETGSIVLILVGGGAVLFNKEKLLSYLDKKIQQIEIPQHAGFANALGAACAKISGSFNGVFQYADKAAPGITTRAQALEVATQKAKRNAEEKGANVATLIVQEIDETPINYVPGNRTLVRVKVVGELSNRFDSVRSGHHVHLEKSSFQQNEAPSLARNKTEPTQISELLPHKQNIVVYSNSQNESCANTKSKSLSLENNEYIFTQQDISDIAVGTGFLGFGGGGNTKICEVIDKELINNGKKISMVPIESISDTAMIIAVGVMGAPTVLAEKLPSKEEGAKVIESLEQYLSIKIDYLIPMEIGGMNGLYAIYIAGQSNKKIIDGDCMGRAFLKFKWLHLISMPRIFNIKPYWQMAKRVSI